MNIELDRGHVEFIRTLQKVQTSARCFTNYEQDVLERLVQDVVMDLAERQPSLWIVENNPYVEYTEQGHVDRISLGRYLTRVMGVNTYEPARDSLVKKVLGVCQYRESHFSVLTGNDLVEAYKNNLDGGDGCMRGSKSPFTHWYAENGVKMLVFRGRARALLWTLDDGRRVLDRIYPNDGPHVATMQLWAINHGAYYRYDNRLRDRDDLTVDFVGPDGKITELLDAQITMKSASYGVYPYLDSFSHGVGLPGESIRLQIEKAGAYVSFFNIDGGPWDAAKACCVCGMHYGREVLTEGFCPECVESATECERCGALVLNDDMKEVPTDSGVECWCDGCVMDSASQCNECDEIASREDVPDDWHVFPNASMSCPGCKDDYRCTECGDPSLKLAFSVEITKYDCNGYSNTVSTSYFCSTECQEECLSMLEENTTASA